MVSLPTRPGSDFMQACWVVPDVREAVDRWVRQAGVGPFYWIDGVQVVDGRYRGEPAEFPDITAAIAYAGDFQIELVSQDDDQPSIFRDMFAMGQTGLHHLASYSYDYEAERDAYIAGGAELAFEAWVGNSRTCWIDTCPTLGFMVELLEHSPGREAHFAEMREAAKAWDGKEPIVHRS